MVKKKSILILTCIITALLVVLAVGAGIFVYKNRSNSNIANVFDEMIENGHTAMENAEHVTAGGFDAIRMLWTVKEGTPLRIGIVYSMEYKKLYIYGDACIPEEIHDMSYQEYFEECLKEYGITWEEVEDSKEDFICKNILGTWFTEYESSFTKDRLGELEVLDFLMPYEYCGKDNSEWMTVVETVEEGYRGAFNGKVHYTIWNAEELLCRQTQKSRDYGYHDIMERIEEDINGFNTVSEDIAVEWDWRWEEKGAGEQEFASLVDIFDLKCHEFVDWLQAGGEVEGNLTKLSYAREEGEEKTREMLKQCSKSKLFRNLETADYYIAGNELNIRLAYYDYETENSDWVENGKGELWQGWITVNIDDIREFLYGNGSDYLIKFEGEEGRQKESEKKENEQKYYFSIEPEQVKENLMGYTLMRTTEGVYYVEDSDYLLEKDIIGKGVFVSEHISEMEIFVGRLLMNVIEGRGVISEEEQQYFSDWAMEQIQKTDWKSLNAEWELSPYLYDRSYTINYLFGDVGYDFTYSFYPDINNDEEETTQIVNVKTLIDNAGIIRGVNVEINDTGKESTSIVKIPNNKGLFDDELQEEIIEEGILYQDKVICKQSGTGLLASDDAAVNAEEIGKIIIDVLESKGKNAAEYDVHFESENDFYSFKELSWNQLEEGWKANQYYDCYYIGNGTDTDESVFLYYIYPDYDVMDTETASALTFRCSVNGSLGKLAYTDLRIYSMTREEYQSAREWLGKKSAFMKDGEIAGGGGIIQISVAKEALSPHYISNVTIEKQGDVQEEQNSNKKDRIYINESIDVYSLGKEMIEKKFTDMIWTSDAITEINEVIKNCWEVRPEYDAYYMAHNEKAGTQLYRYYFYWNKPEEENEKVMVTDIWISQDGIVDTQLHWFMGRSHITAGEDEESDVRDTVIENPDTDMFLSFDWSSEDVLFYDHTIEPDDSGHGWQFFLADIDFDRKSEMLIAFTSNHCGSNSLYVYRQNDGKVIPYFDTIATPEDYMLEAIDYSGISSYMNVGLLDAYVNESKEYRYLSLDCSSHGGDMRGGAYTVALYEIVFGEDITPKEIARITICGSDEEKEYFFLEENVYEAGRLRDMLEDYMSGYEKVEIDYIALEKTFPRDMVGLSDEERAQQLEELYESMRKTVTWEG